MKEKIIALLDQLVGQEEITFNDILKTCLITEDLPSNKGDVYFLLNTIRSLDILKKKNRGSFSVDWKKYQKLKEEWGFK